MDKEDGRKGVVAMLKNPFTPSDIASLPEMFFGRHEELGVLERAIVQGSVAIKGPIGIGKSSSSSGNLSVSP